MADKAFLRGLTLSAAALGFLVFVAIAFFTALASVLAGGM
jgi:hypothetical protein